MKKFLVILMVFAMASVLFVGCTTPPTPDPDPEPTPTPVVVLSATPVLTSVETSAGVSIFSVTSTSTLYMNEAQAGNSILVRGTAPAESLVKIYLGGVAIATVAETAVTGLWTIAIAESALGADGVKVLTAKITEVGLAESLASNAVTFTLDTDAPGFSIAATAGVQGGAAVAGTVVSAIVSGRNPVDAITINSSATIAMVAGTWTISTWGVSAAVDNVTITSSTYTGTKTYQVTNGDTFTNVIPGVTFTFLTLPTMAPGNSATITTTASVLASTTAIVARATITFDETVTAAGMAAGTYTTLGDPTTYKTATNIGYWDSGTTAALAPGLAGATYTISAYGFTDVAGNPSGTLASPVSASCVVGAASQALAP